MKLIAVGVWRIIFLVLGVWRRYRGAGHAKRRLVQGLNTDHAAAAGQPHALDQRRVRWPSFSLSIYLSLSNLLGLYNCNSIIGIRINVVWIDITFTNLSIGILLFHPKTLQKFEEIAWVIIEGERYAGLKNAFLGLRFVKFQLGLLHRVSLLRSIA